MTMLQEAIEDLKVRALGKKIGDEAVLLRNEIKQALSALDDISVESGEYPKAMEIISNMYESPELLTT